MEFKRTDTFTNNETTVISIQESTSRVVGGLNLFLEKLLEERPEIYAEYLERLSRKLLSLTSDPFHDYYDNPNPMLREAVRNLSDLERLYCKYSHQLLEIPIDHSSETFEVTWHTHDRAIFFPAYYRALVLCQIMGREEAFAYLKEYIDSVIYGRTKPSLDLEDLDSLWEEEEEEGSHPSYGVGFRMNRGKFGWRVEKCVISDVMEPMNDPDLCHILVCYGDTASFESMNPNFVYTMPRTLMQGDQCCEKCFHDRRHIDKVEHPSEEFWESLTSKV
jgi:hypothetical protein